MNARVSRARPRFALVSVAADSALSVARELKKKLGWRSLLPLLLLLALSATMALLSLVPTLAPFVYPLF